MRIRITDRSGLPIIAGVAFDVTNFDDVGIIPTDIEGFVNVPTNPSGALPSACTVYPHKGYWATYRDSVVDCDNIVCSKFDAKILDPWWVSVVNPTLKKPTKPLRIGIVDFCPDIVTSSNHHIYRVEGYEYPPQENVRFHGAQVATIGHMALINSDLVDIILIDCAAEDGFSLNLDTACSAISNLAEDHQVDVINLSFGSVPDTANIVHTEALDRLTEEIQVAIDLGCPVVAASGNSGSSTVSAPAYFSSVLGVGSVALSGFAPNGTLYANRESVARDIGRPTSSISHFSGQFFVPPKASYGNGLDVVAPGAGIIYTGSNGETMELYGASFASPIVDSVLAMELQEAIDQGLLVGDRGPEVFRAVLMGLCYDLGMPSEYQGLGLICVA
ncbi:MAG: S8 family serine peptidase [Cohaesibacteraceae bacterium]